MSDSIGQTFVFLLHQRPHRTMSHSQWSLPAAPVLGQEWTFPNIYLRPERPISVSSSSKQESYDGKDVRWCHDYVRHLWANGASSRRVRRYNLHSTRYRKQFRISVRQICHQPIGEKWVQGCGAQSSWNSTRSWTYRAADLQVLYYWQIFPIMSAVFQTRHSTNIYYPPQLRWNGGISFDDRIRCSHVPVIFTSRGWNLNGRKCRY